MFFNAGATLPIPALPRFTNQKDVLNKYGRLKMPLPLFQTTPSLFRLRFLRVHIHRPSDFAVAVLLQHLHPQTHGAVQILSGR